MPNGILKPMKIDNYSHVLEGLNNAKERVGSMAALARLANVDPTNLTRWMTGARSPSLKVLSEILDVIGARIVFPEDEGADFSENILEKNKKIEELKSILEKSRRDNFILQGKIELLKEQLADARKEYEKLHLDQAKENPAQSGE